MKEREKYPDDIKYDVHKIMRKKMIHNENGPFKHGKRF